MIMAGEMDVPVLRAGKAIRELAKEHGLSNPTSEELGRFAARMRQERGPGFFGEYAADEVVALEGNGHGMVIDSFRHKNGIERVRDMLGIDFEGIWISCPRQVRLKRLQRRGRDDEADFTEEDLMERDLREVEELGVETLSDYDFEHEIVNNRGKRHLRECIMEIIDD